MFRELLLSRVAGFCELSGGQVEQLRQHYELMIRWNKVLNLTRIEGIAEAVDRHYAESLFMGANLPVGPLTIADIGSGAGFPGFPIAVLRPECQVTLIESHKRKAVFLKECSRDLANVSVVPSRAEEVLGAFDWVVSRAVSWKELEKVAFRLAPKVALYENAAVSPTVPSPRAIPLPWEDHRKVMFHVKQ